MIVEESSFLADKFCGDYILEFPLAIVIFLSVIFCIFNNIPYHQKIQFFTQSKKFQYVVAANHFLKQYHQKRNINEKRITHLNLSHHNGTKWGVRFDRRAARSKREGHCPLKLCCRDRSPCRRVERSEPVPAKEGIFSIILTESKSKKSHTTNIRIMDSTEFKKSKEEYLC